MDWKSNPWVGVGAAVLLVVGAALLFYWSTGGGGESARTLMTFECDSTGEHFTIAQGELEDLDTYKTYMDARGIPTKCRICGLDDAYQIFYCPVCEKWYRFTESDRYNTSGLFVCPEGHSVQP